MGCGSSKEKDDGAVGPRPKPTTKESTPANGKPIANVKVPPATNPRVKETTPKKATPKRTTPKDTTPKDATPKDTTPKDATPKDTTVKVATPEDTTIKVAPPEDTTVKDTTVKEDERARKKARVAAVSGGFLLNEASPPLTLGL